MSLLKQRAKALGGGRRSHKQVAEQILADMAALPKKRRNRRPGPVTRVLAEAIAESAGVVQVPTLEGPVFVEPNADKLKSWAAGVLLTEGAKRVIGRGLDVVDQTLAKGKTVVKGIGPSRALDHALSPAMLKIAGLDQAQPASAVQLVQLVLGGGAGGLGQNGALPQPALNLLDAVRAIDIDAERVQGGESVPRETMRAIDTLGAEGGSEGGGVVEPAGAALSIDLNAPSTQESAKMAEPPVDVAQDTAKMAQSPPAPEPAGPVQVSFDWLRTSE